MFGNPFVSIYATFLHFQKSSKQAHKATVSKPKCAIFDMQPEPRLMVQQSSTLESLAVHTYVHVLACLPACLPAARCLSGALLRLGHGPSQMLLFPRVGVVPPFRVFQAFFFSDDHGTVLFLDEGARGSGQLLAAKSPPFLFLSCAPTATEIEPTEIRTALNNRQYLELCPAKFQVFSCPYPVSSAATGIKWTQDRISPFPLKASK